MTIDATRRGAPISKYIYGQFIEHLGRCIYGGIWAEMLEDRKFWFPITGKYDPYRATRNVSKESPFAVVGASPWEIVGKPGTVEMVKQDSFVGDHTPRLSAGGAIRQNDLGLLKDKAYVGYIWLRADGGAPTVTVTLRGAEGKKTIKDIGKAYAKHPFTFTAAESTDKGSLKIAVDGGRCMIGTVSLMPGDNVDGMRADTLALLKELDSPVYRWPGGNFVSGYDWKDGIGDRDRRPPRKNPAWTGVE
ncbi:MAG: alpha-L-arabinofuranosidase C-terminal domain-containing protein, partial [Planctomycetota bacterium]